MELEKEVVDSVLFVRKPEDCEELMRELFKDQLRCEENDTSSDVHLVCQDGFVAVHGFLLSCISQWFKEIFEAHRVNTYKCRDTHIKVLLSNMEVRHVSRAVQLIYSGSATVANEEEAVIVREILDFFQIHKEFKLELISNEGPDSGSEQLLEIVYFAVDTESEEEGLPNPVQGEMNPGQNRAPEESDLDLLLDTDSLANFVSSERVKNELKHSQKVQIDPAPDATKAQELEKILQHLTSDFPGVESMGTSNETPKDSLAIKKERVGCFNKESDNQGSPQDLSNGSLTSPNSLSTETIGSGHSVPSQPSSQQLSNRGSPIKKALPILTPCSVKLERVHPPVKMEIPECSTKSNKRLRNPAFRKSQPGSSEQELSETPKRRTRRSERKRDTESPVYQDSSSSSSSSEEEDESSEPESIVFTRTTRTRSGRKPKQTNRYEEVDLPRRRRRPVRPNRNTNSKYHNYALENTDSSEDEFKNVKPDPVGRKMTRSSTAAKSSNKKKSERSRSTQDSVILIDSTTEQESSQSQSSARKAQNKTKNGIQRKQKQFVLHDSSEDQEEVVEEGRGEMDSDTPSSSEPTCSAKRRESPRGRGGGGGAGTSPDIAQKGRLNWNGNRRIDFEPYSNSEDGKKKEDDSPRKSRATTKKKRVVLSVEELRAQAKVCQTCLKIYKNAATASDCIASHNMLRCYMCFKTIGPIDTHKSRSEITLTDKLFEHFIEEHGGEEEEDGERTIKCSYCDENMICSSVSCHVIAHLVEPNDLNSPQQSTSKSRRRPASSPPGSSLKGKCVKFATPSPKKKPKEGQGTSEEDSVGKRLRKSPRLSGSKDPPQSCVKREMFDSNSDVSIINIDLADETTEETRTKGKKSERKRRI